MTAQTSDGVQVCSLLRMSIAKNLVVGRGSTAHGLEMVIHMRIGGFGNRPRATYCMEPTAPVGGIKNRVEWPGFCCDQHSFVINIVLSALNFNLHHPRRGSNAAHKGMITWKKLPKSRCHLQTWGSKLVADHYQSQVPPKKICHVRNFEFAEWTIACAVRLAIGVPWL